MSHSDYTNTFRNYNKEFGDGLVEQFQLTDADMPTVVLTMPSEVD